MRVEHRTIEWFSLAELKESDRNAYDKARDHLDTMLWGDGTHTESVGEVIVMTFAEQIGFPGTEKFGEADFPGIDRVELHGWDIERGSHVAFAGDLRPESSPSLPWHEWLEEVRLVANRYGTSINVEATEDAPYLAWDKIHPDLAPVLDAMETAVRNALNEALAAGVRTGEYLSSEAYLDELAAGNSWEFDINGRMA